jgi:hypothetical protein
MKTPSRFCECYGFVVQISSEFKFLYNIRPFRKRSKKLELFHYVFILLFKEKVPAIIQEWKSFVWIIFPDHQSISKLEKT